MRIDRRQVLLLSGAGGLAATGAIAAPTSRVSIGALRVCGVEAPLALGATRPRFSWRVNGPADTLQKAYRVSVARSAADLEAGRKLVWDSGKVASDRTFDVAFEGPPATSRSAFWWRVEVWDQTGARALSMPSRWETGLMASSDWSAAWLASESLTAKADREAGVFWITGPESIDKGAQRCFRYVFDARSGEQAVLFLAASGVEGVWLNGAPVEPSEAEPTRWTTMSPYPLAVRPGPNVLAIAQSPTPDLGGPRPTLSALIRLATGPDERRLTTAQGWKTAAAAPEGWTSPSFDDSAWSQAIPSKFNVRGQPLPPSSAMFLRRAFVLDKPIASARLYATALGVYEPWINGARIDDRRMAPEASDPSRRILYQAYDVSAQLRQGDNVLGLWVGDGWYGSEFSANSRFTFGPAPCRVLAQLEVTFADGSSTLIGTGDDWRTAPSPIQSSELYDGEVHDARLEIKDWAAVGRPGGDWRPAQAAPAPQIIIDPQISPPIRVTQTLTPRKITEPKPGVYVVDFGQNFAGWARLAVRGPKGARVEMLFAETLSPTGLVDQSNLRTAAARDTYILKGEGLEIWEPRFTYHGFRYVELRGLSHPATTKTLTGLVGHNDLPITGALRVGDKIVEQFWRNSVWSQRSNFFGLPTDCPQRDERVGWSGDAQVFWPAAAYNMDVAAFTARFMGDMRAGQLPNGELPDTVPPFIMPNARSSPGWADAGVILPHVAWSQYGDTGVIEENWAAMERYLAFILERNPDHLWKRSRGFDFGDWLAVDAKYPGQPTTPKDLIGTAYWAADAAMMRDMAQATGRAEAVQRYTALASAVRAAFQAAYVQPDGQVGNGSQTSYILAIRFNLLDANQKREAGRRLAADIAARGGKLSTGFLGTPHILDALADTGQEAVAVSLLLQRDYPSWGYMVTKGATTMWERWNSDTGDVSMNSYNHYAFGAIGAFLFRRVAGLAALEPGFRRVQIEPIFDRRLGSGGADYEAVCGRFSTDWRYEGDQVRLDVTLPSGTLADVVLPAKIAAVRLNGKPPPASAQPRQDGARSRFQLGAGRHRITFAA